MEATKHPRQNVMLAQEQLQRQQRRRLRRGRRTARGHPCGARKLEEETRAGRKLRFSRDKEWRAQFTTHASSAVKSGVSTEQTPTKNPPKARAFQMQAVVVARRKLTWF